MGQFGRPHIGRVRRPGDSGLDMVGDAHPGVWNGRLDGLHPEPVGEEEVVGCGERSLRVAPSGGVLAEAVAEL